MGQNTSTPPGEDPRHRAGGDDDSDSYEVVPTPLEWLELHVVVDRDDGAVAAWWQTKDGMHCWLAVVGLA